MKQENTICYRVDESIKHLKKSMSTGEIDLLMLVENLHKIRLDAQKMEDALKLRKKVMTEGNLEEKYQELKGNIEKEGIHKISYERIPGKDSLHLEFIVKDHGEIVYQNKSHAGLMVVVEHIEDIDDHGIIEGKQQCIYWGHDLAIWYGFNQLQHDMEARSVKTMMALKNAIMANKNADPTIKKQIIDACNGIVKKNENIQKT